MFIRFSFVKICIWIIFASYITMGQSFHPLPGGEPQIALKIIKGEKPTRILSQNLPDRTVQSMQMMNSLPARTNDITQISSFPFQDPYSTYSSYYESCPFTLSNGNILVVYSNPYKDSLFSTKSTDGGTTWSDPIFVCLPDPLCTSLTGIRTFGGRLIIVWENRHSGLSECYSDDNGISWSSIIPVSINWNDYYTSMSQTLNGKLWLCYSRPDSSTGYDIFCRTSIDSGISWSSEQTFSATAIDEYYATIVSTDSSSILSVYEDNSSGVYALYSKTSTDNGTTWSAASTIANSSLGDVRPRLLRQSDGILWLIYQDYKPSTGGYTQSEIAYKKSSDGGNTWNDISYFTNYAGYDGWFNTCLKDNQPFVTFASYRWTAWNGQTHLWYGLIGTSTDYNPPPALEGYHNTEPKPDSMISIQAYVDDESGISNVQLYYVSGTLPVIIQMYDDGIHNDFSANDKIYGASIGPFHLGDYVSFSVIITDNSSNSVNIGISWFKLSAVQNVGNLVLKIGDNSELGDNGAELGTSAYWPKTNGYDYLFDGGLWAGCIISGDSIVAKQEYEEFTDWTRLTGLSSGTPFTVAPGLSDQDINVTYDDEYGLSHLGLQVQQQSYQWSDTSRDDFIIFKYTIKYIARGRGLIDTLNDLYIAQWLDPDVALETDAALDQVGYDASRHLMYMYNASGNPGGYFGLKLLGPKPPYTILAYYAGQDPMTDGQHYQFMTEGNISVPASINDWRFLLTAEPFSLVIKDSAIVTYGIVLGNGLAELQANADTMENIYDKEIVTAVDERQANKSRIPIRYELLQNYPNPFNPTTNFEFRIADCRLVTLKVYNILGEEVATIVNKELPAGDYKYQWDAGNLSSGVYLYRLQAGNFVSTKKLILIK